jgi:hypothetical protein
MLFAVVGALTTTTTAPLHSAAPANSTHWAAAVTALSTAVLAAGAIYAGLQVQISRAALRAQTAELQAQTSRDLWAGWAGLREARQLTDTYESAVALRDAYETFRLARDVNYYRLSAILDYYEQIGVLFELGTVDARFIKRMLGPIVVLAWSDWRLAIQRVRLIEDESGYARPLNDEAYSAFEALARVMAKELGMSFAELR